MTDSYFKVWLVHHASWQDESPSTGHEMSYLLWNLRFHHRIHKNLSLDCILLDPVDTLLSCFIKIHFNIILQFVPQ
jgi:hypothetical protein